MPMFLALAYLRGKQDCVGSSLSRGQNETYHVNCIDDSKIEPVIWSVTI